VNAKPNDRIVMANGSTIEAVPSKPPKPVTGSGHALVVLEKDGVMVVVNDRRYGEPIYAPNAAVDKLFDEFTSASAAPSEPASEPAP